MKFGLLFSQQVPPGSGLSWREPYDDMLTCLPLAEDLGYESCFQVSHHAQKDGLCPGPLIACAGAAAVTKRMRIGTGVLLVPMYAPLKLAEDVAVLDNLSGGRFVFGVAPGYVAKEFEAHGVPREERVGRFEEAPDQATTERERRWLEQRGLTPDLIRRAEDAAPEHREWFQRALHAGVKMALGSDILPLRQSALLEMGLWIRDGATPWQALQAATRNAAELCGVGDQSGTVEAGKVADLIVVAANPLEDIENLGQLLLVLKDGKVVSDRRGVE